jgi:hypothetical protein
MRTARQIVSKVVPAYVKESARGAYRQYIFSKAMGEFLSDPEAHAKPGDPVLNELIRGWGNESFSALDEYLSACIREAAATDGAILECGSGLSTLLVGAVAAKRGLKYVALENNREWANRVRRALERYDINSVELLFSPITEHGEFDWYDVEPGRIPNPALIICDGPPGTTKGGRYGLSQVFEGHLKEGCVILLDDADRAEEMEIANRWRQELNASMENCGSEKSYVRLVVAKA